MTTSTATTAAPIAPDATVTVAVTPALSPIPAIYVPRRPAQAGASLSLGHAVSQLAHHVARRLEAGA